MQVRFVGRGRKHLVKQVRYKIKDGPKKNLIGISSCTPFNSEKMQMQERDLFWERYGSNACDLHIIWASTKKRESQRHKTKTERKFGHPHRDRHPRHKYYLDIVFALTLNS